MKWSTALQTQDIESPLGTLRLAASPTGLAGAWFIEGQRHLPDWAQWPAAPAGHAVLGEAARQLGEFFGGQRRRFDLPLDLSSGTAFQQGIWRALLDIPAGQTWSYGQVARHAGHSANHGRATGSAVGQNPISIIVPCHRVIGGGGELTGYAGGLERKTALLRLEGERAVA